MRYQNKQKRKGASAVEFAFIAPVMFLMILGMIELARGLMLIHMMTNAARAGCRVGILEGKANSDVTAAVNSALQPIGISTDSVTVDVNDNVSDVANCNPGDEVTVVVSVPISTVSWVPYARYLSGNISGQYTLRRE
jgi:Flp pilus assembly protein TadG